MQLLDEIIEDAVNDKVNLSVLLRKCLVLAHQLKNDKLKAWAEYELNGYCGSRRRHCGCCAGGSNLKIANWKSDALA